MGEFNTSSVSKRRYHSPLRDAQAAATRVRILEAALDEFVARGYPGTSVAAIARTAGVSPETIYATFGTKRGIVDALLEEIDAEGRPQQAAARHRRARAAARGSSSTSSPSDGTGPPPAASGGHPIAPRCNEWLRRTGSRSSQSGAFPGDERGRRR